MSQQELTMPAVDALGNDLEVGDIIFYAASGQGSQLKAAKILAIYEVPYSKWCPDLITKYKLRTAVKSGTGWHLGGYGHNRTICYGGIRPDHIPQELVDLFANA